MGSFKSTRVTIRYCRGHQKGNTVQETGNKMVGQVAKQAAEGIEIAVLTSIPDGKLQISKPESEPAKYSREDRDLINDIEGKEQTDK